jgi:capsid protein
MATNVTNAREALMAELLEDVDKLIKRIEQVDATLADKIEQAAKDAASKAFLSAKLNFETMINDNERKLIEAGRYAAAQIGNQMNDSASQIIAANALLARKARGFALWIVGCTLVAGVLGGFVVARLAGI